uniref:Chlororespiratory reduction 4 n=1 Tax=Kalanchoe fedtschenkoi TaxID=63787 RepID=A0A7N0ULN3_KALFE
MLPQIWSIIPYSSYFCGWRRSFGSRICSLKFVEPEERNWKGIVSHILEKHLTVAQLSQVHSQIIVNGSHQDDTLVSHLVSSLIKSGNPDVASTVFQQVKHPQNYLWTCIIRGYSSCDSHLQGAIAFYAQMRNQLFLPNNFNIPFALKACAKLKCICEGEQIHADLLKVGFISDVYVQTSLLDMYVKCSQVTKAKQVFDNMFEKNVVSWTAMLAGYFNSGLLDEAADLFQEMPTKNIVTWNVMIDGLSRSGNIVEARHYFDMMPVKNVVSWTTMIGGYSRRQDVVNARLLFDQMVEKEVVAWTAMISCYVENGNPDEAIEIFREMQAAGVKADEVTMLVVISAGTATGSFDICEWIQNCVKAGCYGSKLRISNALVNMYASVGNITKALEVFYGMSKRDVVSYNSIIAACGSHGFADQALSLFSMMLNAGVRPNSITFTGVLTACAHSGLVQEGRQNFALMHELGFIELKMKHYSCMVDLLGRAGFIDEAYMLVASMPIEPETTIWGALLGACKIHGNLHVAELAANKLIEMESGNPGNFCVLANIYSENYMWVEASKLRGMMMHEGLYKMPGRSLVEACNLSS